MRLSTVIVAISACLLVNSSVYAEIPSTHQPVVQQQERQFTHTPLVTGNGFGYAVVAMNGDVTKFYAHPYRFERPNADVSKDGYSTNNFFKKLEFGDSSNTTSRANVDYVAESQVISVKNGGNEVNYFMPFGLERNALIAVATDVGSPTGRKLSAGFHPEWQHEITHDESKTIDGRNVRLLTFKDVAESLVLVPLEKSSAPATSAFLPGNAWAFIVIEKPDDLEAAVNAVDRWQAGLAPNALVQRELKSLENWRVKPQFAFRSASERKLWRQNETILRMAQIREPNTSSRHSQGLILASLPDGVWFTPWVRDMSYAVAALAEMGHTKEARDGLMAYFNARPVGKWKNEVRNADYQISVTRYFGDGSEEADYSGLQTPNVELDDWGLALWAAGQYFEKTRDISFLNAPTYRGTVYSVMKNNVVTPLLANLDPAGDGLIVTADSSLWEEHQQNKKHFAFTTIAAVQGLRKFSEMASAMKDDAEVKLVNEKVAQLERGFANAFVHDGALKASVEESPKHEIDGSVIEAFNWNVIKDPSIRQKTLEKMELLKTPSGGYRRLLGDSNYEKQEFLFVNFYLARLYFAMGKTAEAQKILDRMVDLALKDHGLIAECYVSEKNSDYPGEVGDPTGSIPMVGYGAGAYVLTLAERQRTAR